MQYEQIKELIEIFEKTDLNDMELTIDNVSLRLNRNAATIPSMPGAPAASPSASIPKVLVEPSVISTEVHDKTPEKETAAVDTQSPEQSQGQPGEGTIVKAPIVGTFYASAAPDKPPFVKVGDTVAEGDTLCIIEAMKFMNEVPSEVGGTITEILVQDGDFVEFGQSLFRIV